MLSTFNLARSETRPSTIAAPASIQTCPQAISSIRLYRRHRHPHAPIIGVGVALPILKAFLSRAGA
jgi:hypothetical protein